MYRSALIGERFGKLTIVDIVDGQTRKCKCDCGKFTTVRRCNLRSGNTTSCGCVRAEVEKVAGLTHGATKRGKWTPEYTAWHGMLQRCSNPNNPRWASYGGRGIKVCARWRESFKNFLIDMGERPQGTSLDRIDNDGNYEPENCRWANQKRQQNNKRSNRLLTFRGETLSVAEWAKRLKIPYFTLHSRLRNGMSAERALSMGVNDGL